MSAIRPALAVAERLGTLTRSDAGDMKRSAGVELCMSVDFEGITMTRTPHGCKPDFSLDFSTTLPLVEFQLGFSKPRYDLPENVDYSDQKP